MADQHVRDARPRVILVEDADAERAMLRELLEGEGVDIVGEAANGADGIDLVLEHRPDVVLMDLRMPVVGGIEATRRIKERSPLTQVIILTVYGGPLPGRSAEDVGAYAYLVKGCSVAFVRDVIFQAWVYGQGMRVREAERTGERGRAG